MLRDNDTVVPGLYAAGECACVSVHGANRLGTNSLLDINVFGRRAGIAAAEYAVTAELPDLPENPDVFVEGLVAGLRDSTGGERVGEIRKAMQETMDMNAQVYRTESTLKQALSDVQELQRRFRNVAIHDKGQRYNTELLEAIELGFLLDLAEVLVVGAHRAQGVPRRARPRGLPGPRRRQLHAPHHGLPARGRERRDQRPTRLQARRCHPLRADGA